MRPTEVPFDTLTHPESRSQTPHPSQTLRSARYKSRRSVALQPQDQGLSQLFDGKLVYIVPNYQRLYVWNRDDQWEPLWSDVRDIAEELADSDHDRVEPHFMGAVVFKISGSTPDLARQYRVIDGQQRLTTLQLLVAAAASALDRAGLTDSAINLRNLTVNTSANQPFKIQYQKHKIRHDYERFPDVIRAAHDGDDISSIDGPMADCYRYFKGAIDEWLDRHNDRINVVGTALVQTLALKLRVVAIYLDPHEKEHAIFESLNARGEPLTEWDKIKNYLLYKADEDHRLNQETFFEQYLDAFDNPWWRQLIGRGVQRPRVDVFSDYWLEAQTAKSVEVRRVFREFQHYMDQRSDHLEEVMKQLLDDARYFRESVTEGSGAQGREALFHERRRAMGAGAVWPLLLKLRHLDIDINDLETCFVALESYLVRRLIAGYQARSYDQVALDLIDVLSKQTQIPDGSSKAIRTRLLSYSERANEWPNDAVTIQAVLQRRHASRTQRLVLAALEKNLIPSTAGNQSVPADLHVEHLLPRGWGPENWPLPDGVDPEQAREERNQALLTLGNLTLLNAGLNSSVSNRAWTVKREKIRQSDNLFLNRRLLEQSGDRWTEASIEKRGRWMGEMIVKIWPREV